MALVLKETNLKAQVPVVDGARAVYARVDSFYAKQDFNFDTVFVNNTAGFFPGDTVLFHQTISGFPDQTGDVGRINAIRNAGKYAIYLVDTLFGKTIILNNSFPPFANRVDDITEQEGSSGQLIRIPTYERARITATFDFPAWDPVSKTGGIFPIMVHKKLSLEADISADGKGFRGAAADESGEDCSNGIYGDNGYFFLDGSADSGSLRGESFNILNKTLVGKSRGNGRIGTGGGGGMGKYAGGGGGSNYGQGGIGGDESNSCATPDNIGGKPGHGISVNTLPNDVYGNRIFMGGGGGAGRESPVNSRFGTDGGNGGGILIVMTDTLEAIGTRTISVNGASVSATANAGAGGGGGGGTLVMEVSNYIGDFILQARGGNGGNVVADPDNTGPGGAGGGGVIQYNGASLPANVASQINSGTPGSISGNYYGAGFGALGSRQANLLVPIRGFIVNTLPDDQTVCEGETPALLNAPMPKGGSGSYTYKWQYSTDTLNWNNAPGTNDQITYQPVSLFDTTLFRRVVMDASGLGDSTFFMSINVHPEIVNNLIIDNDTVCKNLAPSAGLTSVLALDGGDGLGFSYLWEQMAPGAAGFSTVTGTSDQFGYTVPALDTTMKYRRKVESGVCISYSDTVTITVLEKLTDLLVADDQVLCNNDIPAPLTGNKPGGADQVLLRYEWWQIVGGTRNMVATTEDYSPPALPSENYGYRRLVFSGNDDACTDSSDLVNILVYPDITNNTLSTPSDTVCSQVSDLVIDGSAPGGGNSGDYAYYWEQSPNGTDTWTTAGSTPDQEDLQAGLLDVTRYFRRTVYSASSDSACIDVSATLKVEVLPSIVNALTSPDDTICQFTDAPLLTGDPASGGLAGNYTYLWEFRKDDTGWSPGTGINDQVGYFPGMLDDTSYYFFRRVVISGPANTCIDTSSEVSIRVQPSVKDNDYTQPGGFEFCVGNTALIDALAISGGDGTALYVWQDSTSSGSWQDATGINNAEDYTNSALLQPTWYRRIAVSGKCTDTGDPVLADTLSLPVILNLTTSHDTICHDQDDFYLKIEIFSEEGNPVDYTLTYNDGVNGNAQAILGANTDSVNITGFNPFTAYDYSLISLSDVNGCSASEGLYKTVQLWVNQAPSPGIQKPGDPYEVCGTVFSLASIPDTNPGVSQGWWTVDQSFVSITDSLSSTGSFTHLDPAFNTASLNVMFNQSSKSCGLRSDTLEIRLYEQPGNPVITNGDTLVLFMADEVQLQGMPPTAGSVSWSVLTEGAEVEYSGTMANLSGIPFVPETVVRYTVMNGVCELLSDEILILRKEVNVYDGISPGNEDDLNDYLVAEGLDVPGIKFSFQIFSTSGMLVRELDHNDLNRLGFETGLANNGRVLWDGRTRNENDIVPDGTYYYVLIINFKGREFVDKGFVVVK